MLCLLYHCEVTSSLDQNVLKIILTYILSISDITSITTLEEPHFDCYHNLCCITVDGLSDCNDSFYSRTIDVLLCHSPRIAKGNNPLKITSLE